MPPRKIFSYSISPSNRAAGVRKKTASEPLPAAQWLVRGDEFLRQQQFDEAIRCYDAALGKNALLFPALVNRGIALRLKGEPVAALEDFSRALTLRPGVADVHLQRASAFRALDLLDDAIAAYRDILTRAPDHAHARQRLGSCLMLAGRFAEGWPEYEARWEAWASKQAVQTGNTRLPGPVSFGKPLWDGQPTNARVLLWGEQGIGDQIAFASLYGEAFARARNITLAADPRLHALYARAFPALDITTVTTAFQRGDFDLQLPAGGLGPLFRQSSEDFLRERKPYLRADPARSAELRSRIKSGARQIIGLSWRSNSGETGRQKSIALAALAPLLTLPNTLFVNLQYGNTATELAAWREQSGIDILSIDDIDNERDLDGLAALICACDSVISVSNVTAHLAGALGQSVHVLLPRGPGCRWYWQNNRDDALWYPHARLHRQASAGDWNSVIEKLRATLLGAVQPSAQIRTALRAPESAADALRNEAIDRANKGIALVQRGRLDESLKEFDRALALAPDHADIHYKRASTLRALNRLDEALAAYNRVLDLDPGHAAARSRRGSCRLMMGQYPEGWRDYAARWDEWAAGHAAAGTLAGKRGPANFGKPLWDGSNRASTLLVWEEQGLGEQLLFSALLHEAAARVHRVILAADERLHPLLARSFPAFTLTTLPQALQTGGYDQQIPLGNLAAIFRQSEQDFLSHPRAYLKADTVRAQSLRARIAGDGSCIVGLSWLSRNRDTGDMKSLSLQTLAPLLSQPGLRCVDLQYGDAAAERATLPAHSKLLHVDDIDKDNDLDALAALIMACDVVVTVSNTTAHLAAALGKPVLLIVPQGLGRLWYWGMQSGSVHSDGTPWYPSVQVLRQPARDDASGIFERIRVALSAWTADPAQTLQVSWLDMQAGKLQQARDRLRSLTMARPGLAEAWRLQGVIALMQNNPAAALPLLEQAIAFAPDHGLGRLNLGLALSRLDREAEALVHYDRAVVLKPDFAEGHANRGLTLKNLQRFEEALVAYDRALALKPDYAEAWSHRGVVLGHLNRHAEALVNYDRALALGFSTAHWNQCVTRLLIGDFSNGWNQYEWRWKKREAAGTPEGRPHYWLGTPKNRGKQVLPQGVPCIFDPPFWDGTPTTASLLVWPEQGVGEQVMLASTLGEARARVGQLSLILDEKLHALFRRAFPDCRIVSLQQALIEHKEQRFDLQIPMGDLCRLFRQQEADFLRNRKAYLHADPTRVQALRHEINPDAQSLCGLAWFSRNAEFGPLKNIPLEALHPLLHVPATRFVDLQYGDTTKVRAALRKATGIDIRHAASVDNWQDLDGYAALISACDNIVTISTAAAHIAGALGKNVLLMLPHSQGRYWYWQAARNDALWYPNVRIFRQPAPGDWAAVIENVCAVLAAPAQ